jgi:hypothetical protein
MLRAQTSMPKFLSVHFEFCAVHDVRSPNDCHWSFTQYFVFCSGLRKERFKSSIFLRLVIFCSGVCWTRILHISATFAWYARGCTILRAGRSSILGVLFQCTRISIYDLFYDVGARRDFRAATWDAWLRNLVIAHVAHIFGAHVCDDMDFVEILGKPRACRSNLTSDALSEVYGLGNAHQCDSVIPPES